MIRYTFFITTTDFKKLRPINGNLLVLLNNKPRKFSNIIEVVEKNFFYEDVFNDIALVVKTSSPNYKPNDLIIFDQKSLIVLDTFFIDADIYIPYAFINENYIYLKLKKDGK